MRGLVSKERSKEEGERKYGGETWGGRVVQGRRERRNRHREGQRGGGQQGHRHQHTGLTELEAPRAVCAVQLAQYRPHGAGLAVLSSVGAHAWYCC